MKVTLTSLIDRPFGSTVRRNCIIVLGWGKKDFKPEIQTLKSLITKFSDKSRGRHTRLPLATLIMLLDLPSMCQALLAGRAALANGSVGNGNSCGFGVSDEVSAAENRLFSPLTRSLIRLAMFDRQIYALNKAARQSNNARETAEVASAAAKLAAKLADAGRDADAVAIRELQARMEAASQVVYYTP